MVRAIQLFFVTFWIALWESGARQAITLLSTFKDESGPFVSFWNPNSKHEFRRRENSAVDDQPNEYTPLDDQRNENILVQYQRNENNPVDDQRNERKLVDEERYLFAPQPLWSSHEKLTKKHKTRKREKSKEKLKTTTVVLKANDEESGLNRDLEVDKDEVRKQEKKKEKSVKVKKHKKSGVKFNSLRIKKDVMKEDEEEFVENRPLSTRVAPLHLMQQEDNPITKPQKEKKNENIQDALADFVVLNAYDLQRQFTKLLENFSEVEFTSEIVGRTASYINIVLFKITQKSTSIFRADNKYVENDRTQKKIIFIVHALSPMGIRNLYSLRLESHLKMLLSYYFAHLDKFDIYLIPMANPDGYVQALKEIYWNKNVSPNAGCPGVDVDRNFDVAWNNSHAEDSNSCSQHFPGPRPFSEAESRAVRDILHRTSHKIVAYIHVHGGSYDIDTFKGDAVLYPKGFTEHQSDDDKYIDLKGEIEESVKNANFKMLSVTVETLFNWYGKIFGCSVDYAATVYGIPYAMEFVMQLYQGPFGTESDKLGKFDNSSLEFYSLAEIWQRVINVTFTNIYNKLEVHEPSK